MNVEEIRAHCISKKGVQETFPFGNDTLVFKAKDKIFLLLSLTQSPIRFNVKCIPELAIELREQYSSVLPGYHMNKKHWNTILCDGSVSKQKLQAWIDLSYELVAEKKVNKK